MIDLGKRPEPIKKCKSSKGPKTYYPSIYVENKKLPIEKTDIGKIVTATVKMKVTDISSRDNEQSNHLTYNLDVLAIDFPKKPADSDYINERKESKSKKVGL